MMAAGWFYRIGKSDVGPCSPSTIRELVQKGTITPETLLRREDSQQFTRAIRIKGLFAETPAVEVEDEESETDPFVDAAGKAFSSAANAVKGIGGSVSNWDDDQEECRI